MTIEHYPFRFVKKDIEPWDGPQGFLMHRLLYSFKSPKTHQTYWVWIEVYKHHFYAVKFHLKAHRHSDYKYNLMTGLYEVVNASELVWPLCRKLQSLTLRLLLVLLVPIA